MSMQRLSRRTLLRGALVSSVGLAFVACAPQVVKETVVVEKEKVVKETVVVEAASKQVTVRYHCRAGAALAPASEYPTHQNRLIEFEGEHPEIKVVREDIANTDLHDYYVKLATMVAGGTVGDMTWDHQSDCDHQRLAHAGILAPIDEYMTRDSVKEDEWWPAGIQNAKLDGKLYGLPMCTHPGCEAFLFFNKTMFEEAGLKIPDNDNYTLDDLYTACKTLTKFSGDKVDVYGLDPFSRFSGSQTQEGWMRMYGAYSFVDEAGAKSLMNSDAAVKWAEFGYKLYNEDKFAPAAEAIPSGGLYAMFAAGKLAAFQSGTWSIKTSLAAVGSAFEEGIVQFPKGPAGRGSGNYLDTFAMLGDFMEFDDMKNDKNVQVEYKSISESKPQFRLANFRGAEHQLILENMLGAIWVGKEKPTKAYLDSVAQAAQQVLDKPA
jgi:ABC-type glycerol-3-phosphate transport system substrate-binding protein